MRNSSPFFVPALCSTDRSKATNQDVLSNPTAIARIRNPTVKVSELEAEYNITAVIAATLYPTVKV